MATLNEYREKLRVKKESEKKVRQNQLMENKEKLDAPSSSVKKSKRVLLHPANRSQLWSQITPAVVEDIAKAPWKIVDTETTGLSPQSKRVTTGVDTTIDRDENGDVAWLDNRVRCRVITILYPSSDGSIQTKGFDLDDYRMSNRRRFAVNARGETIADEIALNLPKREQEWRVSYDEGPEIKALANACLKGTFIGHNAGFDVGWLRHVGGYEQTPDRILDTLLLSRALMPHIPIIQDKILNRYGNMSDSPEARDDLVYQEARKTFNLIDDEKVPRWGLGEISLALLNKVMDKGYQGPENWVKPHLSDQHFNYAMSDVIELEKIVRILFYLDKPATPEAVLNKDRSPYNDLPFDASTDLLARYERMMASPPHDPSLPPSKQPKGISLLPWEQDKPDATEMHQVLSMLEPQVMDVVHMRENGTPWDLQHAQHFKTTQNERIAKLAQDVAELVKVDGRFPLKDNQELFNILKDPQQGVGDSLKDIIGQAFQQMGLNLRVTEKKQTFKVGEKDLRAASALSRPDTASLFKAWVGLSKAKKTREMSIQFSSFAIADGGPRNTRIHPLTSHGPVTGRLRSGEPNMQNVPSDQFLRDCVRAAEGNVLCASDFSALDMRVGAALAIRCQRRIIDIYDGRTELPPRIEKRQAILDIVHRVVDFAPASIFNSVGEEKDNSPEGLKRKQEKERLRNKSAEILDGHVSNSLQRLQQLKEEYELVKNRKGKNNLYRKNLWTDIRLARFEYRLAQVMLNAVKRGQRGWSSLRNAFAIEGMDIHTWTTMSMKGRDPNVLFKDLSPKEIVAELKKEKKELGDARKYGKVCNLSLTYAMSAKGLQFDAASKYDIHWDLSEAVKMHSDWLDSFPEIDLWHLWTDLTAEFRQQRIHDNRMDTVKVFSSDTLGGRRIFASHLSAALSYEDQSSGADIMGRTLDYLHAHHPDVFKCVINQIHDEILCEFPAEKAPEYEVILHETMVRCANDFTAPYGVRCEATPATGFTWMKEPAFDGDLLKTMQTLEQNNGQTPSSCAQWVGTLALKGIDVARRAHDLSQEALKPGADINAIANELFGLKMQPANCNAIGSSFKGSLPPAKGPKKLNFMRYKALPKPSPEKNEPTKIEVVQSKASEVNDDGAKEQPAAKPVYEKSFPLSNNSKLSSEETKKTFNVNQQSHFSNEKSNRTDFIVNQPRKTNDRFKCQPPKS